MSRPAEQFVMTEEHIVLLRAAYVDWDDCSYGAPYIDPKRPYGNGDVLPDLARLLNPDHEQMREGAALDWLEDNAARLERVHRETLPALEVVLSVGYMRPGRYVRMAGDRAWRPVDNETEGTTR